ncbi:MAG: HAMP domain-containing protein [Clostridia bacterium]|nr:HAMP domain-containing protein [Clostridia bacterium]
MFKSIRLKITLVFVLAVVLTEIFAGLFVTVRSVREYHKAFDELIAEVLTSDMRKTLTETANAVTAAPAPDGGESIVLSEPGPENVENLKNIMLGTDILKTIPGMSLAILDGNGNPMYQNDESDFYKHARVTEEALKGNEAVNNRFSGKAIEYAIPLKDESSVQFVIYLRDPMTQQNSLISRLISIFVILITVSAILMIVIALMFSKTLSAPLKNLASQAKKLADGDTSALSPAQGNDEISELTNALIYLSETKRENSEKAISEKTKTETILQNMSDGVMAFDTNGNLSHINPEAMRLLNRKFVDDITFNKFFKEINADITIESLQYMPSDDPVERQVMIGEHTLQLSFAPIPQSAGDGGIIVIIHDVTKHEKLERARLDFVANVSHELRTPLTVIKSYSDILADTPDAEPELRTRFLDTISSETDRMARIISDLLTLSSLDENTNYKRPSEEIDIRSEIEGLVERLSLTAKKKEQELVYTPINDVPKIKGDRGGLERVLTNIISNALKYTPTGGKIQVFSRTMYNDIIIKVSDTGIGISKEQLPNIFDRFFRVDKARSRDKGGTGLGLAIAKQTIESVFHGKIMITSELNKGTDVTITIPLPKNK